MKEAVRNGVTGITTNDPVTYTADEIEALTPSDVMEVDELPANGAEVTIKAKTYKGEEKDVKANVVVLERNDETVKAVLCYDSGAFGLSSKVVTFKKIEKTESTGGNGEKKGCGGSVGGVAMLCGLAAIAAVTLMKKREDRK